MVISAEQGKICSPSTVMVTLPYEWNILKWDENPPANKQTNKLILSIVGSLSCHTCSNTVPRWVFFMFSKKRLSQWAGGYDDPHGTIQKADTELVLSSSIYDQWLIDWDFTPYRQYFSHVNGFILLKRCRCRSLFLSQCIHFLISIFLGE